MKSREHHTDVVRATAIDAAAAAGALIRSSFRKSIVVDHVGEHDLKLRLDREAEEVIFSVVRKKFASDAIFSEEAGYLPGEDPYVWIADPLDGTVNYYHGIPLCCTCVSCHALSENRAAGGYVLPDGRAAGDALAAVVYCPLSDELFVGAAGHGAALNGSPLRSVPLASISEAIVSLSLNARDDSISFMGKLMPRIAAQARKVRSLGSTGLEIVFVAAGRTGAFIQLGTNLWDFAAAACILKEAGGTIDAREFAPGRWKVVASNQGITEEIRKLAEL